MPTYEYRCRDCSDHVEVWQSFHDEPLTECAACGGSLRKVFNPAGIIFKGSGYYVTDTRAERQSLNGNGSKPSGDGAGSGDTAAGDAGGRDGDGGGESAGSGSDGQTASASTASSSES